jgi:hypothetical protein
MGGCTAFLGYRTVTVLQTYTSEQPLASLPTFTPTPAREKDVLGRLRAFRTAVDAGESAELVLNSDDLNTYVALTPELAGKVFFAIAGDQLRVQGSFPFEQTPFFQGKYLNGTMDLNLAIQNGELFAQVEDFDPIDGELSAPTKQAILDGLELVNLGAQLSENPRIRRLVDKVQSLDIRDGKMVIRR